MKECVKAWLRGSLDDIKTAVGGGGGGNGNIWMEKWTVINVS